MHSLSNPNIGVSFEDLILFVKFRHNAYIEVRDLDEIYTYGNINAEGRKYAVIFEADGHYEVSKEALQLMVENPNNANILAKVYIVNSKEAETKTKLHLDFDKPKLTPDLFTSREDAIAWLKSCMKV